MSDGSCCGDFYWHSFIEPEQNTLWCLYNLSWQFVSWECHGAEVQTCLAHGFSLVAPDISKVPVTLDSGLCHSKSVSSLQVIATALWWFSLWLLPCSCSSFITFWLLSWVFLLFQGNPSLWLSGRSFPPRVPLLFSLCCLITHQLNLVW